MSRRKKEKRDNLVGLNVAKLREFNYGAPALSGVQVNEPVALSLTAVYSAVNRISSTLSTLPLVLYKPLPNGGKEAVSSFHPINKLMRKPNQYLNGLKFRKAWTMAAVCTGNGIGEIIRDQYDQPIELNIIPWKNIELKQKGETLYYELKDTGKQIDPNNVIHLSNLGWGGLWGQSPILTCRESVGTAIAQERHASATFGNSARPGGILKTPQRLNEDAATRLRQNWEEIHGGAANSSRVAILENGMEWVQTQFDPVSIELLKSRSFSVNEISRLFQVPPSLLYQTDNASYQSNSADYIEFYQSCIRGWLENIEAELNDKLLGQDSELFFQHRFEGLLRGNLESQSKWVTELFRAGIVDINESRDVFAFNPRPNGNELYIPVNQAQIGPNGEMLAIKQENPENPSCKPQDAPGTTHDEAKPPEQGTSTSEPRDGQAPIPQDIDPSTVPVENLTPNVVSLRALVEHIAQRTITREVKSIRNLKTDKDEWLQEHRNYLANEIALVARTLNRDEETTITGWLDIMNGMELEDYEATGLAAQLEKLYAI
jgi:HK97 family phage portal protein